MNRKIKVLLIQNRAILGSHQVNIEKIKQMTAPLIGEKFDITVLPEVWSVGWYCPDFEKMALRDSSSPVLDFLSELAQSFKSNVIGGSYIRKVEDGSIRNTMPVFDRAGKLIAQYDKMHLFSNCGCNEGKYVKNGLKPVLVNLDIAKVGLSVCYDIRFPELYRAYAYAGAEILVNCAAWPKSRPHHWDTLTRARAIENQCFMIAVSQSGLIKDDEYNLGHSQIIAPFGEIITKMGNGEGIVSVEIDVEEQKKLRDTFPVLKDRHEPAEYTVYEVK